MVIVLSPNPAYRLREQWLRLWRRSRSSAVWIALNIAAFLAAAVGLPATLLLVGGLLTAREEQPVYLLVGGALSVMAIPLGRKTWRWGHDILLGVAGAMVEQRHPFPDQKPPLLTRMEGRALREALTALDDVRAKASLAGENGNVHPLRVAAERWRSGTQAVPSRVSLRRVQERIDVVGRALTGAANATDPEDVRLHAEVVEVVLGEVEQAFRRALRREQMGEAAYMWPETYGAVEREDREEHGGRVYRPLRLRRTSLPRTVRMPRPYLHGYEVAPGAPPEDISEQINPSGAWASGGIVSTPNEVGRFFRAYVRGRLFGRGARRQQRRFVVGSSSPPGPGGNASGLGLFRYRTRCGTVYGHTGSFPGYRLFAASSADGRRSVVFSVNAQIVPGQGSARVSTLIRRAQVLAVCHALRRRSGPHMSPLRRLAG